MTSKEIPASFEMPAEFKATFINMTNYLNAEATAADEDSDAAEIVTGSNRGIKLETLRGLDKDLAYNFGASIGEMANAWHFKRMPLENFVTEL